MFNGTKMLQGKGSLFMYTYLKMCLFVRVYMCV